MWHKVVRWIKYCAIAAGVLLLWWIGSRYTNPLFLPKPEKTWETFVELIGNGMLVKSTAYSLMRITSAMMLSALISVPIGMLICNYKWIDKLLSPVATTMRFIPPTVFYPLFIMWFGIDESMKIMFLFVAQFLYFLPSVILCIREVNTDLVETAYTMGMSKFQVMIKVVLPYSLPSILQNFLVMYGIGWTYVIVAEVVNARYGLGFIMNLGSARGRTDLVFVPIFTIIILSKLFDSIGNFLIKRFFAWKFAREVED